MSKKPLYEPETGIHRAKGWEIAFYALNNSSTNLYMFIFMYITYYLTGIAGVGVALAGTIMTVMRIWDGITDPIVGFVVDKTNGKFGKNRPFIVIGQLFMAIGTFLIFFIGPKLPMGARFIFFILCYMFYIIGYTAQCVVTKSAQTCLTNDPKQRPIFSVFDSVYNVFIFAIFPIIVTTVILPRHDVLDAAGQVIQSGFTTASFHQELWILGAGLSAVMAVLAIIGLWRKDRTEFYGTGEPVLIKFRDYVDVVKHNRPIQMLCLAACSDKLFISMQTNAVVMIMLFGIIVGDYGTYASFTGISSVLTIVVSVGLIMVVARNMGQKKAMLMGTYGGMVGALVVFLLLLFGNPHNINYGSLNFYTIAFTGAFIIMKGFGGLSSTLVIPMTADCADYEVYRSGKYAPGLMGTLFSFIDKVTSSLASTLVALMLTLIGFKTEQPTPITPYSEGIFWVTMACLILGPMIGWLLNLVAMKYYDLDKDKMAEIQEDIARIKAGASKA